MSAKQNELAWYKLLAEIAWRPVVIATSTPLAILAIYDLVRSEFIPIAQRSS